jgi:hypothetical protein
MKKYLVAVSLVLLAVNLAPALAAPVGNVSAGRKYFLAARDLSPWSTGIYLRSGTRTADVGDIEENFDYTRFLGYIAYDFFPWLTPYLMAGSASISLDGTGDGEYKPEFGFGVRFNVLHHDIMDATLFEDVLLINASCQYSLTEATREETSQELQEFYATATLSILNEITGSKLYLPEGISIFLGPSYSLINTPSTTAKDNFGILVGMEVYYTKRISFYLSAEMMGTDSTSAMVGINLCL